MCALAVQYHAVRILHMIKKKKKPDSYAHAQNQSPANISKAARDASVWWSAPNWHSVQCHAHIAMVFLNWKIKLGYQMSFDIAQSYYM